MTDPQLARQWILALSLIALLLSLAILTQIATRYAKAYLDAPTEISAFLDAIDSSIVENESYEHDISRVKRLEDKLRLNKLLREIQKGGDALREDISALMEGDDYSSSRLTFKGRLFWGSHRRELGEKVRRVDLLRMRFLVVYMGVIAGNPSVEKEGKREKAVGIVPLAPAAKDDHSEKLPMTPMRSMTDSLGEGIKSKPPLRRLTLHAMGHQDHVGGGPRQGWAGVMQELQKSPVLRERHASIELAMSKRMG
ncbi:hypothetical protein QBC38DRAFT_441127 [Podospora fimiseda]|uniref:Uncharacterized protein n=1 Tax=Podospora fimiseda TaxID=252190 RepID=A0AAN7H6U8_9PEZI|nr:hypothetical protein QBC38DRAFT_441127 [Podospora fimiseda]